MVRYFATSIYYSSVYVCPFHFNDRHNYCGHHRTETDEGFIIIPKPGDKTKWDDSDYHEYRDELLIMGSI